MKITSLIRSRRQKKIKVGKRKIIMKKERKKKNGSEADGKVHYVQKYSGIEREGNRKSSI
jgi:hypothetical protein